MKRCLVFPSLCFVESESRLRDFFTEIQTKIHRKTNVKIIVKNLGVASRIICPFFSFSRNLFSVVCSQIKKIRVYLCDTRKLIATFLSLLFNLLEIKIEENKIRI